MKIFTLLISALFISLNIFAQELDSILVENWSLIDSDWENEQLISYHYSDDQLSVMNGKDFDTNTDTWINGFKQEYLYSAEGNLIQTTTFFWDEDLDDWGDENKTVYTNDAAGNSTTITTSYLEDGEWQPAYLAENTFNTDGLLTETISQNWNDMTSEYDNSLKITHTYDSNGNRTHTVNQSFYDPDWVNLSQTITQFTSFNAEEIATRQNWDAGITDWIDKSKRTYTYNSDETALHSLFEQYNSVTGEWEDDEQELFTNNADGSYQIVTQEYNSNSSEWENDIRTTISFRFASAVYRVNPLVVGVYPNPASTDVNIQLGENTVRSTYTITDMSGKILANDSFYGSNTQISIDRFATGIYILEVEANGKTGIVKLVRE